MATHKEVARNWAMQTGRATKGHHMFYSGNIIYSYGTHFPIARIVPKDKQFPIAHLPRMNKGLCAVLQTSRSYSVSTARHCSVSTARHCSIVRVASCREFGGDTFVVDNVLASTQSEHIANFDYMMIRAHAERISAARRRRSEYAQMDIERADAIEASAQRYWDLFVQA